ncbi:MULTISPECIES: hypothetical protein [Acinetobacter]|uniref:hypothetical protein n=1 Tax=Acinetobacter TaxID=469 RepID=UPI0002CF2FBF|nr:MULTISPECIES: hypothetical protein [Acinetobacter]ENW89581.1 hypothetical protein F905_01366 [Acinetobacter sp. CIP 53.82]MBA0155037.1 hypothetical protein [Acinetobacter indicus]
MSFHGRKLTQEEYEYFITKLIEEHGDINSEVFVRKELELTIDYRLGVDFPKDRREALWLVHQKIEKKRKRMLVRSLIVNLLPHLMGHHIASRFINYMLKEYSHVLSNDEMKDLFIDK